MGDDRTAADGPFERFPCSSRVMGLLTLAGTAVVLVLVIMDGTGLGHLTVLAAVILIGLGVWSTMVRPSVDAHEDHVLVRNALTDTRIPWHLVESVEVRQVLVIRTEHRLVHGLAVGRTARQQLRQSRKEGAGGSQELTAAPIFGGDSTARVDYADYVAQRIDTLASAHRRQSEHLKGLDKRWRSVEATAVLGVAAAFAVLLAWGIAT